MKGGRNLTVNESNYVKSFRLNPANWLMSKSKWMRGQSYIV